MKKRILFVDDDQRVLDALRRTLHSQRDLWEVTCVACPKAAWEMVLETPFDAVVADVQMPGMSGLELLARIRATPRTRDVPVIVLTGLAARELKRQALNLGAADLLSKPVEPEDLVARLRNVLRLKDYEDALRTQNEVLEERVRARTRDLLHARLDIIWRLGKAAEHRDDATGNHVIRVGCTSRVIAEMLGKDPDFVETLFLAAPLHDIGKIGIPDAVLLKRGPLSPGEWEVMKRHCQIGARILREDGIAKTAFWEWRDPSAAPDDPDQKNPFLEMAASIAMAHHERWDASGYPRGLAGEEIPPEARIVAISDVFDAVCSRRPYKEAYDEDRALEIIRDGEGTHFDPDVLAAFLDSLPEIRSIRERFADTTRPRTSIEETADEADPVRR
ncbi:MAG: response regulator [Planctomycetia bacterium]|nr:response regulator [Planctomycetia bacterium]